MFTEEKTAKDTITSFKEAVGWLEKMIGPANVRRLEERIDDLHQKSVADERGRILKIVDEEASHYSYKEEMVRPSVVAAIFANSVKAKVSPT